MGLFSSLKSKAPAASPVAAAADGELWRKGDFEIFPVGPEQQATLVRGGAPQVFPGFAIDFALGCEFFKPLAEHIESHAEKHGWSSLQLDSLRSWLPKLKQAGVLLSTADLRSLCLQSAPSVETPAKIAWVGFPTGGERVEILARALVSFLENTRAHGRETSFVVADSSVEAKHREAFQRRLGELREEHGAQISCSGEEEKRLFARELERVSGASREAIDFAIFDPLGAGFACGANRNALLLHGAGEVFCSVDDDVVCRFAVAPEGDDRLALFSNADPFWRSSFIDRESAYETASWLDADFLALHEELLGRSASTLVAAREIDAEKVGDELLRRLAAGDAKVRATFAGHVGDPGIPTSLYYLYHEHENRRRLVQSEEHYRAVFASRSVMTVTSSRALGDASVSPGMTIGLDHRELLPPCFPVLHAEDLVFGAAIWQLGCGSLLGHVPVAVKHEPLSVKPIFLPSDLAPGNRALVFEFTLVLKRIMLRFQPPEHATSEERMIALGRHLAEVAAPREFRDFFRRQLLDFASEKMAFLAEALENDVESPDFWRRDVEHYLEQSRAAVSDEDFDIPLNLRANRTPEEARELMRQLVLRYGQLLQHWPAMVRGAAELKTRGISLARPV